MKNSDVIKTLLLAAVNEIAADSGKYAVNPGRDFTRNRKMGFHDTLMMPTLSLNLTANLQGASTRSTSMPFIPSSTAGSPTS